MSGFMIVGITGRSGSGKSMLTRHYASLGYPVLDGDALSREIMAPGSECVARLAAAFGEGILYPDGSLDRKALAALAFATPEANATLIGITHPLLLEEMLRRAKVAEERGARLFFVDGAMIVGGPFEPYCKPLILVRAEQRLSISRICLRDGISKTAAQKRLDAQLPVERLCEAADYVIDNNGAPERLFQRGDEILRLLLEQGAGK